MLNCFLPIPKNKSDVRLLSKIYVICRYMCVCVCVCVYIYIYIYIYVYILLTPELSSYLLKNCHRHTVLTLNFQEKEKHIICSTRKLYSRKMFQFIIYVNPTSVCVCVFLISSLLKKTKSFHHVAFFFLYLVLPVLEGNSRQWKHFIFFHEQISSIAHV